MKISKLIIWAVALFIVFAVSSRNIESFGTSPGTMQQLSSTHVPTEDDAYFYKFVYPQMIRKEITNMTEGDPGEMRPWQFPWYGRGVTLFTQ